jgi:hypothetical protein
MAGTFGREDDWSFKGNEKTAELPFRQAAVCTVCQNLQMREEGHGIDAVGVVPKTGTLGFSE